MKMRVFDVRLGAVLRILVVALLGVVLGACPPSSEGEGEGEGEDEETIMLRGGVALVMVWVPAGSFMMGRNPGEADSTPSEDPRHLVTISSAFWMSKYEVTKAQWKAVMRSEPWSGQPNVLDEDNSPAVYISWDDAQAFLTQANTQTGLAFRLPTEAEWEYACRAGTTTRFYWGDDLAYTVGDDYAWWRYNTVDVGQEYVHLVGQKLPNAWGLCDMSGNALEWCQDWYGNYSSGDAVDPQGPLTGTWRIMRGGSVAFEGFTCRSANRTQGQPSSTGNYTFGLRLVR